MRAAASEVGTLERVIRLDSGACGMSLFRLTAVCASFFLSCQSLEVSFFRAAHLALTAVRKKQSRKSYSDGLTRTSTLACYAPPDLKAKLSILGQARLGFIRCVKGSMQGATF